MEVFLESLQERSSLKMTEERRRFIMVDDHEAVKIGELEKTLEPLSVVKPEVTADVPEAAVREGADELTLRRGEGTQRTFINFTSGGGGTVDGDLRLWTRIDTSFFQAIYKVIEGEQWEKFRDKYVALQKVVILKKLGNNQRWH